MKKLVTLFVILLAVGSANAAEEVTVTIDSHVNASNYLLETCGTAQHSGGLKPLLVTVKHDESSYTTLTDKDGKWCVVIKRWTNKGEVSAEASVLSQQGLTSGEIKFKNLESK